MWTLPEETRGPGSLRGRVVPLTKAQAEPGAGLWQVHDQVGSATLSIR